MRAPRSGRSCADALPDGSQPVYAVGDEHVLKLFPAAAARDGIAEGRVLSHLAGRLPVPTPRVHAAGPYENGWRYVLMSRLRGENLAGAWDRVPRSACRPRATRRRDRRGPRRARRSRCDAARGRPRARGLGRVSGPAARRGRGAAARARAVRRLTGADPRVPRVGPAAAHRRAFVAAHRGHAAALPRRSRRLATDRALRLRAGHDRRPRVRLRRSGRVRHPWRSAVAGPAHHVVRHRLRPGRAARVHVAARVQQSALVSTGVGAPADGTPTSVAEAWFGTA